MTAAHDLAELFALAHDPETSWMDWAICPEVDPEIFFPGQGGSLRAVKAICRQCPVREECLEYALERPELEGVWAGTGERERRLIRAARDRAARRLQTCGRRGAPSR
jgi:WhiB family redox-sensing transcriptional regulator